MATQRKAKVEAAKRRVRGARTKRVILFPTEPTTIPRERIEAAVDAVIAARKQGGKTQP